MSDARGLSRAGGLEGPDSRRPRPGRPPRWSRPAALLSGTAAFAVVVALVHLFRPAAEHPMLLTLGLCALLALGFALGWPGPSWRWGVWTGSPFWALFAFVFVTLLLRGEPDPRPGFHALGVLATGALAGGLGSWLRRGAAPPGPGGTDDVRRRDPAG